jgi:hypothetical protein
VTTQPGARRALLVAKRSSATRVWFECTYVWTFAQSVKFFIGDSPGELLFACPNSDQVEKRWNRFLSRE